MSTGHDTLSKLITDAGLPVRETEGVVWAESSANPNVINSKQTCAPGEHAVGLTQICTNHCGEYGLSDKKLKCIQQLQDPRMNLKVAKALYDAHNGFAQDWPTFSSGASKKFEGKDAVVHFTTAGPIPAAVDGVVNTVEAPFNAAADVGTALSKVVGALFDPSTYLRIGKGALGGMLIVLGTGGLVFIVANKVSNGNASKLAMVAAEA